MPAQSSPMTFADPRLRYSSDSLATVSGPRVVVMCFDRLDRDLAAAVEAISAGDHYQANATLTHAQELLHALAAMLDVDAWEHASTLADVYDYLVRLLTVANMTKRISKVEEAQRLVSELGSAFREAAQTVGGPAPAAASGFASEGAVSGGFSAQA